MSFSCPLPSNLSYCHHVRAICGFLPSKVSHRRPALPGDRGRAGLGVIRPVRNSGSGGHDGQRAGCHPGGVTPVRAVLLDFYCTLVDLSDPVRSRRFDDFARQLGLPLGPGELYRRYTEMISSEPDEDGVPGFVPYRTSWLAAGGRLLAPFGREPAAGQFADAVRAENRIHGSDQQSCSPDAPPVMITGHVSAVRLPSHHAGDHVAAAIPA